TPAHVAAFVDVYVLNPDGQAVLRVNAFSYGDPPTISQINPNVGAVEGGTEITITGSHFVSGATVTIGLAECTGVAVPDDTMLSCTTTANAAGTYDVTVTNPDGQTVTETGGYTYQPAPSIASVSPSAGPVDRFREITITGENFD